MLLDPEERCLVSNLAWADQGSLWVYDTAQGRARSCKISDAKFMTLHQGNNGLFSIVHHYDNPRFEISVHSFSKPEVELSRTSFKDSGQSLAGDSSLWSQVPSCYVTYLDGMSDSEAGYRLVRIMEGGCMCLRKFAWYTDEHFDKGYQGIVGVFDVPERGVLLVSVQRSSVLIIEDANTGQQVGSIDLGGIGGNPELYFDSTNNMIWASDYDSILRLRADTFEVVSRLRLQETDNEVSHLFIGNYLFDKSGSNCLVPRPFSADALLLDTLTSEVKCKVDLGQQPLEGAILSNGQVICRNWRDGMILEGRAPCAD